MAVKWAHDDPNPEAQRQIEEADRHAVLLMVAAQDKLLANSTSVDEEGDGLDEAKEKAINRLKML